MSGNGARSGNLKPWAQKPVMPLPHPKIGLAVQPAASESGKETLTSYAARGHLGGRSADVVTGCTSEKAPATC